MPSTLTTKTLPIPTFKYLDDLVTILGSTKLGFWPCLSAFGSEIHPYGTGNDAPVALYSDENGGVLLNQEGDPTPFAAPGLFAVYNDSSTNNHQNVGDDADLSHGNGTADTAFSLGAWIFLTEALGTARTIMAKYGSTANLEEYDFRFDTSGNLVLELHDASASASETGTGASDVLVPFTWQFVVATYDGTQTAPDVHLYKNASDTLSAGTTTESGSYVAMENTASGFLIGARDATGTPAQEFEGKIALPFITGKELTSAEVGQLYAIGQKLLGLV